MASFRLNSWLLALIALSSPIDVSAHSLARPYLQFGTEIEAPIGFVEMCRTEATFCAAAETAGGGDARPIAAASADVNATPAPIRIDSDGGKGLHNRGNRPDTSALLAGAFVHAASLDLPTSGRLRASYLSSVRLSGDRIAVTTQPGREAQAGIIPVRALSAMLVAADNTLPLLNEALIYSRTVNASAASTQSLERINRFVNSRVVQRTDLQVYGKAEVWHRSGVEQGAAGDCEDIAIEKRFELIQAGYRKDHLYFAVVYEHMVGLHTVLVARTDRGDYVLDSRTPYIKRWDETPYSFVAVQSMREPMRWFAPGPSSAETALAAPVAVSS